MKVVVAADSLALPRPFNVHTWRPGTGEELGVRTEDTYSYLLDRDLRRRLPGEDVYVMNRGQRHRTMPDVAAEVNDLVHFLEPDVLVVHVGIVDCWLREELGNRPRVSVEQFLQALLRVGANALLRPGLRLVLVGICPTSHRMEARTPGVQRSIGRYDAVLRRVAREVGYPYVDMAAHVDPDHPETYLLPDGSHLNRAGNRLVADELLSVIAPAPAPVAAGAGHRMHDGP